MAWVPPTSSDFVARYPQFAGYDPALVDLVLADSNMRIAEGAWADHDKTPASLALTAHMLAMTPGAAPPDPAGSGGGGGGAGSDAFGTVKSRSVGDVRVEYETKSDFDFSSGSGGGSDLGILSGLALTPYGRYYLYLMKMNFPGVAVVYR